MPTTTRRTARPARSTRRATPPPATAEALRLSEEKFAKAFRLSSDAVLISSFVDGRILDANDSFYRTSGYTSEEVIGHHTAELGIWRNLDDRAKLLMALQTHGQVRDMEFEFRAKDGQIGLGLASAHLIEIAGEQCLITIARDITAQKQAEDELREYTAELQASNTELETFAHMVAHDLKSPLSNIVGFAELLRAEPDFPADQRQEYINRIARNAAKLHNIIDELLLLAQTRKAEVELLPIDMERIVAEVQVRLAFPINEAQATLKLPRTWPAALGYTSWVEEVWINYVSNAIKYGGQPPRIELGGKKLSNGYIRFWVRDNGHGIPPEEQAHLFTAFGKKSRVRATGYGLGLSIVKQIVEKMGGQVGVESDGLPGKGSMFYFTLPQID